MDIWGRIYLDHWRGEQHPHRFVRDDGNSKLVELVAMIDPLHTMDPEHLGYHDHNRAKGRPPRLVRARIEYRDESEEWWDLWMPTQDEMVRVTAGGGWRIDSVVPAGASRLYDLRPLVSQ